MVVASDADVQPVTSVQRLGLSFEWEESPYCHVMLVAMFKYLQA